MKAKLATLLRKYFLNDQPVGLCTYIQGHDYEVYHLFFDYCLKWPHALKRSDGFLSSYFIPASIGDTSVYNASCAYGGNKITNPLRRDLANFIVKQIAREQKKKFVPISFDNSPPIE